MAIRDQEKTAAFFAKVLLALLVAFLLVQPAIEAFAAQARTSEAESLRMARVCIPKDGHATSFTLAGTSLNMQLTPGSPYLITCNVDAWYELGDGSAPTANTDSMPLWAKTSIYIGAHPTTGQSDYLALLDQATDGSCWVLECE